MWKIWRARGESSMREKLLESLLTGSRGLKTTRGLANMAQSGWPRLCPILSCLDRTRLWLLVGMHKHTYRPKTAQGCRLSRSSGIGDMKVASVVFTIRAISSHVDCLSDGILCLSHPDFRLHSILSIWPLQLSLLWHLGALVYVWGSRWSDELPPIGTPLMLDCTSLVTEPPPPDFSSRQLWTCCLTWWQHWLVPDNRKRLGAPAIQYAVPEAWCGKVLVLRTTGLKPADFPYEHPNPE